MRHHFEKTRPGIGSFQDCDVQECAAGHHLGHLADDSPQAIPGRQVMAAWPSLPVCQQVWVSPPRTFLENIYYGVSLMMGRVKVGDYIICDGTRGRGEQISYTSTMLEATDGSVIAFQNSQLLLQELQEHDPESMVMSSTCLEVGVAYGTNVKEVKQILIKELNKLDCINKEKGVKVVLKEFRRQLHHPQDSGLGECTYTSHGLRQHYGVHLRYAERSTTSRFHSHSVRH